MHSIKYIYIFYPIYKLPGYSFNSYRSIRSTSYLVFYLDSNDFTLSETATNQDLSSGFLPREGKGKRGRLHLLPARPQSKLGKSLVTAFNHAKCKLPGKLPGSLSTPYAILLL